MGQQASVNSHEYSMEWIYHFTCSECKNWWSYPTTEVRIPIMGKQFYCPLCGFKDTANKSAASIPYETPL